MSDISIVSILKVLGLVVKKIVEKGRFRPFLGPKIWPCGRKWPYIMGQIIILPSVLIDINVRDINFSHFEGSGTCS